MASRTYILRSKENRQLIIYTDAEHTPEKAYPLAPRATLQVELDEAQIAYVRENYSKMLLIH